jgi:hypothetical protein
VNVKAAIAAIGLCAFATAPPAATFRVDDSLSLPNEVTPTMKWRSLAPSREAGHAVEGSSVLTIRLNLAPWLNRTGKIYMALPEQPVGQVTADWTTQGKLLAGQLVSGNRTLVYAGPIRTSLLEDTIVLRVQADGRRLVTPQRLQFYFEIDLD